jgi:hypothetical protein
MSNILWIEDFESDPTQATEALFKEEFRKNGVRLEYGEDTGLLKRELCQHGVFLELTFWAGWKFITSDSQMETIEYVVLDIDLKPSHRLRPEDKDEFDSLLYRFGYLDGNNDNRDKAIAELKRVAGYHLYIELIHTLGFPKDNILICSNHADILSSFENSFEQAKIDKPRQFKKSAEKELQKVIGDWRENSYYVLRRGILDGCSELKNKKGAINQFIPVDDQLGADYLKEYLNSLELFLPLRQPKTKALLTRYKLFIRTLVHECDLINLYEFNVHKHHKPIIVKKIRNLISHQTSLFNSLTESDLAYLFLLTMRTFFGVSSDTLESYEQKLLTLFDPINSDDYLSKRNNLDLNTFHTDKTRFMDYLTAQMKTNKKEKEKLLTYLCQAFWLEQARHNADHGWELSAKEPVVGDPDFEFERHFFNKAFSK